MSSFATLRARFPADRDYSDRTCRLLLLGEVLDGTIYDRQPYPFHTERTGVFEGEYVPLNDRAPSVRCGLCRTVVDDSVALLFGEGRFPTITHPDRATQAVLARLAKETDLARIMTEAALAGSVGSVAILARVMRNRVFHSVLNTAFLTPVWKQDAPDTLARVVERSKVKGHALADIGYTVAPDDLSADFWFHREWDEVADTWFVPVKVANTREGKAGPPVIDDVRTEPHGFGFVPIVWIRNLPGGDDIDGACTFRPAIETAIEIDYQLSQAGRGLRYQSDPTLVIKEPAATGDMVRSAANALVVSEAGDAKLLEIGGTGSAAVIEYCRHRRDVALESCHGNRMHPDRLAAAQSGRALEMLNQPLIQLADQLRHSYGGGLLEVLRTTVRMQAVYRLAFADGSTVPELRDEHAIGLRWPAWFAQSVADRQTVATTLRALVEGGLLSRATAARIAAEMHDVDPDHEAAALAGVPAEVE